MKTNQHIRLVFYFIFIVPFEIICETEFERELRELTYEIVKKYFKRYRCVSYITANLEEETPLEIDRPFISVDLTDDFSQFDLLVQTYEQGCGGYVIRTSRETKEELVKTLIDAYKNSTNFRYNNQRYLYLPYDEDDKEIEVLNLGDMYFLPNFLMVTAEKLGSFYNFSFVAHNYFNGEKYDLLGVKTEIVGSYNKDDKLQGNTNLYPDKIKNLKGKKIILGMLNFPIYAIVGKENNKTIFDGLETRVAATFVKLRNGSWDGIDHPVNLWGEISEGKPAHGVIGSVLNRGADMGFSAIYQWYCEDLSCSYPYVYSGITCMVPKPQLLPGWSTIVLPFTQYTWTFLISAYLISSCFVFFVSVMQNRIWKRLLCYETLIIDAFFITLRLQVEQIPKTAHKNSPLAVYLKWLIVYYFFVASCWIGGIASILTVPRYESPINTVYDLTSRYPNLKWGGDSPDWTISIKQSSEPLIKEIVQKFVVEEDDVLLEKTKTRDFAFFVERLPQGHYGMNGFITEESLKYLKIMEQNIYTANVVTVMPKGSPYQEKLDKVIFRMFETGLVSKLEVQVALEKANSRLHNLIRLSNEKPAEVATRLKIRHLEGPLRLYALGVSTSVVVFIMELFFHRIKTMPRISIFTKSK